MRRGIKRKNVNDGEPDGKKMRRAKMTALTQKPQRTWRAYYDWEKQIGIRKTVPVVRKIKVRKKVLTKAQKRMDREELKDCFNSDEERVTDMKTLGRRHFVLDKWSRAEKVTWKC